jgi:hypothetical protein
VVDHQRPLLLSDGLGGAWELPNRSEELVRQGEELIPESSAQFDLAGLVPRPSNALPLRISLPLQGAADQGLMLSPEPVAALSTLTPG